MDRSMVKQLEKEKNSNFNVENCVVMFIYWGTIINVILPIVKVFLPIVNVFLPIVNVILPIVNVILPIVKVFLPIVNVILPIVNVILPIVKVFLPIVNVFLPIVNVIISIVTVIFQGLYSCLMHQRNILVLVESYMVTTIRKFVCGFHPLMVIMNLHKLI